MRPGRVIAHRYRLEQPLASGGMGTVWTAEHIQLGIQVAVKFMDPELTSEPDLRSRFEREAKSAAQLQSPHIIHIHDYGVDGDVPFIAMELLRGEDLQTRLERCGGVLPIEQVVKIVVQTCKALRAAHDAGIVHRDLKPSNIFLMQDGEDELVKVLDFGIAKETGVAGLGITSKHDTSAREILGSPAYISPEQIRRARAVDHRTDLWSLAVIAFQAITGALPFDSDETGDLLARILTEQAPRPSQLDDTVAPALDAFFARALERNVEDRFQSARELARAFAAASGTTIPLGDVSHPELPALGGADASGRVEAAIRVSGSGLDAPPSDGAPSSRRHRAPAEAFRTDAPGSVDVLAAPTPAPRSRWMWLAVAFVGTAAAAYVAATRFAPSGPLEPAATGAATRGAPPSVSREEPPSAEDRASAGDDASATSRAPRLTPAASVQPGPSASTPWEGSSRAPRPDAPRPAPPPHAAPPKPKSDVLGF